MSVYRGPIKSGARLLALVPARDSLFIASDAELSTAFPDWRRLTGRTHRRSWVNPFTKGKMDVEGPEWEAVPEDFETHVDVYAFEQLPQVRYARLEREHLERFFAVLQNEGLSEGNALQATASQPVLSASLPNIAGEYGDMQEIVLVCGEFVEAVAALYQDEIEELGMRWAFSIRRERAKRTESLLSRWFGSEQPLAAPLVIPEMAKPKRLRRLRDLARRSLSEGKPIYLWSTSRDD